MSGGQRFPVRHHDIESRRDGVAHGGVEGFPGERGAQFHALKSFLAGRRFARLDDASPNPAPRPVRMDEEGSDAGSVVSRVEQIVALTLHLVAAIERLALAPTAATNDLVVCHHGVVGAVRNELAIDAEDVDDRALNLTVGVVPGAERTRRFGDQLLEARDVVLGCQPQHQRHHCGPDERHSIAEMPSI